MTANLHNDSHDAPPRILFAPVPSPHPPASDGDGTGGLALPEWWVAWTTARPDLLWFGQTTAEAVGLALLGSEEEIGLPIEMGEVTT